MPPVRALLLGAIPFGVPFNLAWLVGWILLSTGCLAIASRLPY